jgi:hypothetical protein
MELREPKKKIDISHERLKDNRDLYPTDYMKQTSVYSGGNSQAASTYYTDKRLSYQGAKIIGFS